MFDDILQEEHPEKNGWWINELESLGVDTKNNADELGDKQDNSNLVEGIKQTLIEEYKETYHEPKF
ncbi:MAG: hypothetical protein JO327_08350 [Nitrososphaeraceae archaeon]|nr:hypothetical protein [Nitrososphaeraceae archaeon]MBV9668126.1 hypothetical protein [Nitrososphaeraceae archaeon]